MKSACRSCSRKFWLGFGVGASVGQIPSDEHAVKASGASPAGPGDNDVSTEHGVDLATASFLGEVWDSYGGCFAGVKLVIPAACRPLPVGGAA